MEKGTLIEICQRIRGLRAAQKNAHYTFETYGEHLICDRFATGDANGFDCNGFIDEIQECVAMYQGESIDEIEIDSYAEEFSLALTDMTNRPEVFANLSRLFRELIDLIDESAQSMNTAEANLFGNISQAASRAAAFYDRLKGKMNGTEGTESEGLAENDASGGDTVV